MEENNMIRDHVLYTCLDARLKERLAHTRNRSYVSESYNYLPSCGGCP